MVMIQKIVISESEKINLNKINKNDLVVIMWSQPHRIADYSHESGWDMPGNAYLYQPRDRMIQYYNDEQNALENLSYFYQKQERVRMKFLLHH